MSPFLYVAGGVVMLLAWRLYRVVRRPLLRLDGALEAVKNDRFAESADLSQYEHEEPKPLARLNGANTTVYYWRVAHDDGTLTESLRVEAHGFRNALDAFYVNGAPVRVVGGLVKLEILENEALAYERQTRLLMAVRQHVARVQRVSPPPSNN